MKDKSKHHFLQKPLKILTIKLKILPIEYSKALQDWCNESLGRPFLQTLHQKTVSSTNVFLKSSIIFKIGFCFGFHDNILGFQK